MGLELAKSSPVFLKGLCLLIISIQSRYYSQIQSELINSIILIMFGLIAELFSRFFGTPTYNICLLGIQQTGKTALFNTIKNIQQVKGQTNVSKNYQPTIGMNFTRYSNGNDKFIVWDLGGKSHIRKIWQSYYSECHGIIFIINKKVEQGLSALKNVLVHQEMAKIPLIVLVTDDNLKQDVEKRLKQAEWIGDRKYVIHQIILQNAARSKFFMFYEEHQLGIFCIGFTSTSDNFILLLSSDNLAFCSTNLIHFQSQIITKYDQRLINCKFQSTHPTFDITEFQRSKCSQTDEFTMRRGKQCLGMLNLTTQVDHQAFGLIYLRVTSNQTNLNSIFLSISSLSAINIVLSFVFFIITLIFFQILKLCQFIAL